MRTPLGLLLVFLVGGCDSASDVVPISVDMIVELTDPRALRVSTDSYAYCGIPLVVDSETRVRSLDVFVRGAAFVHVSCDALVRGSWSVSLPEGAPVDIRVHHRGATDRYVVRSDDSGYDLVALRTSTTRLAE